jgi:hypothetical protein
MMSQSEMTKSPSLSPTIVFPEGWLPLSEVITKLNRSPKTVERLTLQKELESKLLPIKGRKPLRIYSEQSVTDLAARFEKRAERAPVRPKEAREPKSTAIAVSSQSVTTLESLLTGWLDRQKLWLTLEEASAYSGLSGHFLMSQVFEGTVKGIKAGPHGAWRIQRESLENFNA